jgi:molybdenum cofactor guanylyltransferase
MRLAAIILVGGASTRMGADKAALLWNGRRAVDRIAEVAGALGAEPVLTVGTGDYGLRRADDTTPGGGPVSGVVSGVVAASADACDRLLVLAVDAATVRPEDLGPLIAAPSPGAVYDGLNLPLVMDLIALPAEAGPGWSVARLIDQAGLARISCPPDARLRLRGANTPQEREILLSALVDTESGVTPGAG